MKENCTKIGDGILSVDILHLCNLGCFIYIDTIGFERRSGALGKAAGLVGDFCADVTYTTRASAEVQSIRKTELAKEGTKGEGQAIVRALALFHSLDIEAVLQGCDRLIDEGIGIRARLGNQGIYLADIGRTHITFTVHPACVLLAHFTEGTLEHHARGLDDTGAKSTKIYGFFFNFS